MAWWRIDDSAGDHPKFLALEELGPARYAAAVALWWRCGVWVAKQRTDGAVPSAFVRGLRVIPRRLRACSDLVDAGLWLTSDSGWTFCGWQERNPTAETMSAKTKGKTARQKRWRDGKRGDVDGGVDASTLGGGDGAPLPSPPLPSPPDPQSSQTGAGGSSPPAPEQGSLDIAHRDVKRAKKRAKKAKAPTVTGETWLAYSAAYAIRYGSPPVRNQRVNGQLAHFIKRVGVEEAPAIAGFYITHNARWYVTKGHPVSAMLADSEKLRTEWATDRKVTSVDAKEAESADNLRASVEHAEAWKERFDAEKRKGAK